MGMTSGMPHIIYLYADSFNEWNCSQWRALTPSDAINAAFEAGQTKMTAQLYHLPSALDWRNLQVQAALGKGDILIWQRNVILPEIWEAMDYWRALGKLVLVDLDDHYPGLIPSIGAYQYWIRNVGGIPIDPVKGLEEGLRHADALLSPSKVILQDWAHVVPGYWLPNWPQGKWYRGLDQRPLHAPFDYVIESQVEGPAITRARDNSADWIILGWGGSLSHVDSWLDSGIMPALDNLFSDCKNLRLKFCGNEDRLDFAFGRWGDRVIRQNSVKPDDWPLVVSSFDIGLAPLDTRPLPPWREGAPLVAYDERRSWLKGVEYLCAGVPWIASRSLTYAELERRGHMVDNTVEGWMAALRGMIRDLEAEKREAWRQRKWAMNHLTFESNVQHYADVMGRIQAEAFARRKAHLPGITYVLPKPVEVMAQ